MLRLFNIQRVKVLKNDIDAEIIGILGIASFINNRIIVISIINTATVYLR